jgi:CheY-like chemotaxis protein
MNLLGNALKFTADCGDITLTMTVSDKTDDGLQLVLAVSDSGIGINEKRLGQIFDPYQQAEISTSRIYGGTGLGLSLCRQIVELMSGDIVVSSVLEEGSTFTATVMVQQGERVETTTLDNDSSLLFEGMNVLVAEDNVTNRKVIEKLLKKLLANSVMVNDGQQLLDCVDDVNPDLILMDCHMPVLDGFDATRQLRARGVQTPIFALTAGVTDDERKECFEIGMSHILTKPVTLQSLRMALSKLA